MGKKFQLPPGATGIDHYSGASFRADRFGRVELPEKVARGFEKNGALRHYDVVAAASGLVIGLGEKQDRTCPKCHRTAWDWESTCGRCGAELQPKEQA
jgi:hypothetical protein